MSPSDYVCPSRLLNNDSLLVSSFGCSGFSFSLWKRVGVRARGSYQDVPERRTVVRGPDRSLSRH